MHVPAVRNSVVGSGVAFPDVSFKASATDIETTLIYDAADVEHPVVAYQRRLVDYWSERTTTGRRGRLRPLSPSDVTAVVERIAGDFNLVRSLRAEVADIAKEMVQLTEQQAKTFRGLDENPRVLVRGTAGTGKTLIAVADAKRLAQEGHRVLFSCHSSALRDYLAKALRGFGASGGKRPSRRCVEISWRWETFQIPADPTCARLRTGSSSGPWPRSRLAFPWTRHRASTRLILDEAQDLLTGPAKDVFDVTPTRRLEGAGPGGCSWIRHRTSSPASSRDVVDSLTEYGLRFRLTTNCRNTSQIARDTAIAAGRRRRKRCRSTDVSPYGCLTRTRRNIAGLLRSNFGLGWKAASVRSRSRSCHRDVARARCSRLGFRRVCRLG